MPLMRGTSLAVAYARCRDGVTTESVEEALLATWDAFLREGPTDAELARAQVQSTREWLGDLADVQHRADAISQFATQRDDPGYLNRRLADVQSLTATDVTTAARRWLPSDRRGVLVYRSEEPS